MNNEYDGVFRQKASTSFNTRFASQKRSTVTSKPNMVLRDQKYKNYIMKNRQNIVSARP